MSTRNRSLALLCLALTWIALPAYAQMTIPNGPNLSGFCASVCPGGDICLSCRTSFYGPWITCAEYSGAPANDWDRDGVANASDNCSCTANANQANCDGDSAGDACDVTDNSWVNTGAAYPPFTCHIDIDNHAFYETMEFYRQDIYRSVCTGATCVKKVQWIAFNCYPYANSSCCNDHLSSFECNRAWDVDTCGHPRCSF